MSALTNRFVLRPLELKHIFDFTLRIYRAGFAPMFLAMAIVQIPLTLLWLPFWLKYLEVTQFASTASSMGGNAIQDYFLDSIDSFLLLGVLLVAAAFYQLLIWPLGALTCSKLAMQILLNERWSFAAAFRHARERYWPTQVALATFVLPLLVLSLLVLIPVLIFSTVGNEAGIISSALIGLSIIPLGVFVTWIFFFRMYPALTGALQSLEAPEGNGMFSRGVWYLKRAWQLTSGHGLRSFGYFFLLQLALNFITRGMTDSISLFIFLGQIVSSGDIDSGTILNSMDSYGSDPLTNGLIIVAASLIGLFTAPIYQTFSVCLYTDLRCRKEGLDLQLLLGTLPQPQTAPADQAGIQ